DPATGDPLPDQLRLLALRDPPSREGLLPLRQLRAARGCARLRGAGFRPRTRAAADPLCGQAAPNLARRRVCHGRDRRAPGGCRPRDARPLLYPARRPLRALDRTGDVLRAALAAGSRGARAGQRTLTQRAAGPIATIAPDQAPPATGAWTLFDPAPGRDPPIS